MQYFIFPADEKGACIRDFSPIVCETLGDALSAAYRLHDDLPKFNIDYDRVIISKYNI